MISTKVIGVIVPFVVLVFFIFEMIDDANNLKKNIIKIIIFFVLLVVFTIIFWPYLWNDLV